MIIILMVVMMVMMIVTKQKTILSLDDVRLVIIISVIEFDLFIKGVINYIVYNRDNSENNDTNISSIAYLHTI